MLTKTSLLAVRLLMHLGLRAAGQPQSPRRLALELGESQTYIAKVARLLVRAGILRAHRGAQGGVVLDRDAKDISLLYIVEACQGTIVADSCPGVSQPEMGCAYHQANAQLHAATVAVLKSWTLAQFLTRPAPELGQGESRCQLQPWRMPTVGMVPEWQPEPPDGRRAATGRKRRA